jgi:hypothetical protein
MAHAAPEPETDPDAEFLKQTLATFQSQKALGDKTFAQLSDEQFFLAPNAETNSIAITIQHMAGNMRSRFTDFLTTDGEKPDRNRDGEFEAQALSRAQLLERWDAGWQIVFDLLGTLTPADLLRTVYIRGEAHNVMQALMRQLSHYGYHVGQLVYAGKFHKDSGWKTLSIARGQSKDWRPPGRA